MIDEYWTWQFYGYYSDELSYGSETPIIACCDECCQYKVSSKHRYHDLCQSCSHKGNHPSEETKQKMINTRKGKHHTEETKQKISAHRGKDHLNYGRHHSEEAKQKIAAARKDSHHSEETRIIMSCRNQGILVEDFDGFLTEQKYCSKFNESLKTEIRDQYNNCDYISGIYKDICNQNRELSVHHVNYDKDCGCNGEKCKLIPLSQSNHAKTNTNRFFWNSLFIYALEYDKTYYTLEEAKQK